MSNLTSPPAIIFVNENISSAVKEALIRQLDINESISGTEFDARLAADPNYPTIIKGNNLRLLVSRNFADYTNRTVADITIFIKNGLAAVEKNNFGPPNITLPVDKLYYTALFYVGKLSKNTYTVSSTSLIPIDTGLGLPNTPPISIVPPASFTLTSVTPSIGDVMYGTYITITGTNFSGSPIVSINGVNCTNISVISSTQIDCITPLLPSGIYDISINISGTIKTLSLSYEVWSPTSIVGARVYDITAGITQSLNLISQWNDQGSGMKHLSQSVDAAKPTYVVNAIGYNDSVPIMTFDGNDYMQLASKDVFSSGKSFFFVARENNTAGRFTQYATGNPIGGDLQGSVYGSGPGFTDGKLSAVNYVEPSGPYTLYNASNTIFADGTPRFYGMIHKPDGTLQFFVNNSQEGIDQTSAINTTYYGWDTIGTTFSSNNDWLKGCDLAMVFVLNGVLSNIEKSKLYSWSYGKYLRGSTQVNIQTNSALSFSTAPKDGCVLFSLGSTLYLFGGWATTAAWESGLATTTNEFYSSADNGATWSLISAHDANPPVSGAGAKPRRRHTPAYTHHKNYMYILGSDPFDLDAGSYYQDVWRFNGTAWERMTANAGWGPRVLMMAWSIDNKLYMAGGQTDIADPSTAKNDIWVSSDDGATWSLHTANAPWAARGMVYAPVLFNNKIYIIGGGRYHNTPASRTYYNDVWSFDGTTWTEVLADGLAPWSKRQYISTAVFGGYMWIVNGYSIPGSNTSDCWRSKDGINWYQQRQMPWPATHASSLAITPDGNGLIHCGGIETSSNVYKISII